MWRAHALLESASELMSKVNKGEISLDDALTSDVISQLLSSIEKGIASMEPYRSAKLWIMYMRLVSILRSLIRSGRTGNWKLYLQTFIKCFPN
jgi:hypothetical protein